MSPKRKASGTLPEAELVALAKAGDAGAQERIVRDYRRLVLVLARKYFLIGAESEDVVQEGMIGLFKAIRDYDAERSPAFKAFVILCVRRQIQTAVKIANRLKNRALNEALSLDRPMMDDDPEMTFLDAVAAPEGEDPDAVYMGKRRNAALVRAVREDLSRFERTVLALFLQGLSYKEIAARTGKPVKSADTALQRVRRKLREVTQEDPAGPS
jgi:RNA polymerase sporulation-specific sigma factor